MNQQELARRRMQYLADTLEIIKKHGWAVQGVFGTREHPGPSFHYTVGLAGKGLPEFIIFGLEMRVGQAILNDIARRAVDGQRYQHGDVLDDLLANGYLVRLIEVRDTTEYLTVANKLYGGARRVLTPNSDEPVRALQLLCQDLERRWPWQPGYSIDLPILGDVPGDGSD